MPSSSLVIHSALTCAVQTTEVVTQISRLHSVVHSVGLMWLSPIIDPKVTHMLRMDGCEEGEVTETVKDLDGAPSLFASFWHLGYTI